MSTSLIKTNEVVRKDGWGQLKAYTAARIALGSAGNAMPIKEVLRFKTDHAFARDAVQSQLTIDSLLRQLEPFRLPTNIVKSKARDRKEYLQRPDLGRKLNDASTQMLRDISSRACDVAIILADGLSATAINKHAIPVLQLVVPALKEKGLTLSAVTIVEQARVAIGDEIGSLLNAKMSIVFVGERPGLSSPDSMGVYLTHGPVPGVKDNGRNCISNIRPEGLMYATAADMLLYMINASLAAGFSGVALKDQTQHQLSPFRGNQQ
jgi:ethanolamine ammonia-lyase small subunit